MTKYVPVLETVDCVQNLAEEIVCFCLTVLNLPKCLPVVIDSGILAEHQEKRSVSRRFWVTCTGTVLCQDQGRLVVSLVGAKINWFGCFNGEGGRWPSRPVVDSWFTSSEKSVPSLVVTPHHTALLVLMWVSLCVYNVSSALWELDGSPSRGLFGIFCRLC